jgi:Zn-dependent protease
MRFPTFNLEAATFDVRRALVGIEAASLRIGRLGEAPVELHASFSLAMLALVCLLWAGPARSDMALLVTGIAVALASMLVHELAHVVVARRYRIPLTRIDVHGFGSVAQFGSRPVKPRQDYSLAYAGPASNLLLALGSGALLLPLLEPHMVKSGCESIQDGYHPLGIAGNTLAIAMYVNLALALVNLLPFPRLDGSWSSYDNLRARAGQPRAGFMIVLLTFAQGAAILALLVAVLTIGIPGHASGVIN